MTVWLSKEQKKIKYAINNLDHIYANLLGCLGRGLITFIYRGQNFSYITIQIY